MSADSQTEASPASRPVSDLDTVEVEVIDFFIRGVQVLGLPKSIGEIYGLLYISPEPLPLDAIVKRLRMSKGSASQGLRFLKNLGAINSAYVPGDRRDHFLAETSLKKLVGGFLHNELGPHLESGANRLEALAGLAELDDGENAAFRRSRIMQLDRWRTRGGRLMSLVEKFLH